jgi:hypothetical protein
MDMEYIVELPKRLTGEEVIGIVERTALVMKWKYDEMPCFFVSKTGAMPVLESYRLEAKKGGALSRFKKGSIVFSVSSAPDGHHEYPDDKIRRDGSYTALVMYGYGVDVVSMAKFMGGLKAVMEERMPDLLK